MGCWLFSTGNNIPAPYTLYPIPSSLKPKPLATLHRKQYPRALHHIPYIRKLEA